MNYGSLFNRKIIFLALVLSLILSLAASDEYNFNTCGSEGYLGPDPGDCTYSGDNEVDIIGDGIQVWEVPRRGIYRITAEGAIAAGYVSDTGHGARISGEFELEEGEELKILVGQRGKPHGGYQGTVGAGGGGGTFVTRSNDDILVIAGGGGAGYNGPFSYSHGQTSESGADGDGGSGGSGGSNGGGGGSDVSGEGGAGYSGGGSANAQSFLDGGRGDDDRTPEVGGFGGGGSGWSCCHNNEFGGGGGYSGGGGAESGSWNTLGAGGGGSKNNGDNQENEAGVNDGHGSVEITLETDPNDPVIQTPIIEDEGHGDTDNPPWIEIDFDVDIDDDDGMAPGNELEYCEIEVTGQDNGGTETYSNSDPSGDNCNFEIENDDNDNWENGEEVEIEAYVEDSFDGTDTLSRTHEFPYPVPEIIGISANQYSDEHAFNLTLDAEFGRDNFDDLLQLDMSNNGDEDDDVFDVSRDNMWKTENGREVEYVMKVEPEDCPSDNCDGDYIFDVEDDIESEFNLTDVGIGWDLASGPTEEIPNRIPDVSLIRPQEGALLTEEDVTLEVSVSDSEDDPITLIFEDSSGNTLEEFNNLQSGEIRDTEWSSLPLGDHEWTATAEDDYSSRSETFSFTRVISESFRLEKQVRYDYNSLILTEGGTGNTFIDITNPHPDDKEIHVALESQEGFFDPTFSENSDSEITIDLSHGEIRTLQVGVTADDLDESENDKLIITSTDTDVGSVDVAELDILVRSSEAEQRGVPGLTNSYLLFIGLVSVLLFGLLV